MTIPYSFQLSRLLMKNPSAQLPYIWMDNNCQHFAVNLYVRNLDLDISSAILGHPMESTRMIRTQYIL